MWREAIFVDFCASLWRHICSIQIRGREALNCISHTLYILGSSNTVVVHHVCICILSHTVNHIYLYESKSIASNIKSILLSYPHFKYILELYEYTESYSQQQWEKLNCSMIYIFLKLSLTFGIVVWQSWDQDGHNVCAKWQRHLQFQAVLERCMLVDGIFWDLKKIKKKKKNRVSIQGVKSLWGDGVVFLRLGTGDTDRWQITLCICTTCQCPRC